MFGSVGHLYAEVNAGDVVIFTEATTHGTLPWKGAEQRRNIIYRFSPVRRVGVTNNTLSGSTRKVGGCV